MTDREVASDEVDIQEVDIQIERQRWARLVISVTAWIRKLENDGSLSREMVLRAARAADRAESPAYSVIMEGEKFPPETSLREDWRLIRAQEDRVLELESLLSVAESKVAAREAENAELRARMTPTQTDRECAGDCYEIWFDGPTKDDEVIDLLTRRIAQHVAARVAPWREALERLSSRCLSGDSEECYACGAIADSEGLGSGLRHYRDCEYIHACTLMFASKQGER